MWIGYEHQSFLGGYNFRVSKYGEKECVVACVESSFMNEAFKGPDGEDQPNRFCMKVGKNLDIVALMALSIGYEDMSDRRDEKKG